MGPLSQNGDAERSVQAHDAPPPDMVEPQSVGGGLYRVRELLGEGGMGVVYLAEREGDGALVALKMMRAEFVDDPALRARLAREAEAVRRVRHPNVVALLDAGEDTTHGPYLVFERLTGEAVADRLARVGKLPLRFSLGVLDRVLAALDAAHAVGVVHRDLKPENVFLVDDDADRDPYVKVIDFGISRIVADKTAHALSRLTRTGSVVGTPVYMAPEQALGDRAQDERVDVYSAGVLLYEMLTGALPYAGENYNQVLANVLNGTVIPLATAMGGAVDPDLAALVHRALAREPGARFASAAEMRAALRDWVAREAEREARATAVPPCPSDDPPAATAAQLAAHDAALAETHEAREAPDAADDVAQPAPPALAQTAPDLAAPATACVDAATAAADDLATTLALVRAAACTPAASCARAADTQTTTTTTTAQLRPLARRMRRGTATALLALLGGAAAVIAFGVGAPLPAGVAATVRDPNAAPARPRPAAVLAPAAASIAVTAAAWELPLFPETSRAAETPASPLLLVAPSTTPSRPARVASVAPAAAPTPRPAVVAAAPRAVAAPLPTLRPTALASAAAGASSPLRRGRLGIVIANPYRRP